jgi:hypothetical protein
MSSTSRTPLILDACVGGAMMYDGWQNRLGSSFISIDIRKGNYLQENDSRLSAKTLVVKPTVLADLKHLPFKDGVFEGIVCDPPHFACGIHSFLRLYYGSWDHQEVKQSVKAANVEFARVLKDGHSLLLKIMPTDLETYQKLLTNFVFYLPMKTVRPSGICTGTRKEQNSAIFCLGIKVSEGAPEPEQLAPLLEVCYS